MKSPNRKALIELAKSYQLLTSKDSTGIVYEKKQEKVKLSFELCQGITNYFEDYQHYRYEGAGLIYISLPNFNKRVSLKTGIWVSRPRILYDNIYYSSDYYPAFLLKFPIQLQYNFPYQKFNPRLEIGYTINEIDSYLFHTVTLGMGMSHKLTNHTKFTTGVSMDIFPPYNWKIEPVYIVSHSLYLGLKF
jgi:hypothetical protein